MPNLEWKTTRNLEDSLKEFLETSLATSNLTVFSQGENLPINVQVGFPESNNFTLPLISVYVTSKTALRFLVGSNKRDKSRLMQIQIRALDDGMREDLAEWVAETINNGFPFYEYEPSESTPNTPTKTLNGKVNVEFVSDSPARLLNAEAFDKYLHNISISLQLTNC